MKKLLPIFTVFALLGTNAFATYCSVEFFCQDVEELGCEISQFGHPICNDPNGSNGPFADYEEYPESGETSFTAPAGSICTPPEGKSLVGWRIVIDPNGSGDGTISGYSMNANPGQVYNIQFSTSELAAAGCDGIDNHGPLEFRFAAVYGDAESSADTVISSKKYVDAEMAKLQPQFAGLGNNKLMTYSSTTNGAVGSRDIVTTLGTSTTDTSVPTIGAINTALATKQNTVNGTAGYVMTNTGTAGSVGEKPVYSSTAKKADALVEAGTLNQTIIDAVNSELTEVAGIGWQINTANNLSLLSFGIQLPDASINGTSYCSRNLESKTDYDGQCSVTTKTAIGASGSKTGKWGAVMPYGDIVGKSVCSATNGTNNTAATDAQESSLTTEFNNQTGVGTSALSNGQLNCWCKMESIAGEPAVSRWVFFSSISSVSDCAYACAGYCAGNVRAHSAFRSGLFNSVQ
ncbi:MAG: hypothetical protein J5611_03370 [Alphaproteobacteria bacterium]|nr:hypothetical protein [Alphaproteobacteria bacterium]